MNKHFDNLKIAVVIPCYKVTKKLLEVIEEIPDFVQTIYVVDDACPILSVDNIVKKNCFDKRVRILKNEINLGVGGAVKHGYIKAIEDNQDIVVKIDADGQMNPKLIDTFVLPIINKSADYTKGNRFYDLDALKQMPKVRIFGNAAVSFLNKFASGYWSIFDPTNGYTAIDVKVLKILPLDKISNRFFFESDMLFRLGAIRAMVKDIPMQAVYGDEVSNLKIRQIIGEFALKYFCNFWKRVFYNYLLRDFSIASVELLFGILLVAFGICFGGFSWIKSVSTSELSSAGTVMLSGLPVILGTQLILNFINYDILMQPKIALVSCMSSD